MNGFRATLVHLLGIRGHSFILFLAIYKVIKLPLKKQHITVVVPGCPLRCCFCERRLQRGRRSDSGTACQQGASELRAIPLFTLTGNLKTGSSKGTNRSTYTLQQRKSNLTQTDRQTVLAPPGAREAPACRRGKELGLAPLHLHPHPHPVPRGC